MTATTNLESFITFTFTEVSSGYPQTHNLYNASGTLLDDDVPFSFNYTPLSCDVSEYYFIRTYDLDPASFADCEPVIGMAVCPVDQPPGHITDLDVTDHTDVEEYESMIVTFTPQGGENAVAYDLMENGSLLYSNVYNYYTIPDRPDCEVIRSYTIRVTDLVNGLTDVSNPDNGSEACAVLPPVFTSPFYASNGGEYVVDDMYGCMMTWDTDISPTVCDTDLLQSSTYVMIGIDPGYIYTGAPLCGSSNEYPYNVETRGQNPLTDWAESSEDDGYKKCDMIFTSPIIFEVEGTTTKIAGTDFPADIPITVYLQAGGGSGATMRTYDVTGNGLYAWGGGGYAGLTNYVSETVSVGASRNCIIGAGGASISTPALVVPGSYVGNLGNTTTWGSTSASPNPTQASAWLWSTVPVATVYQGDGASHISSCPLSGVTETHDGPGEGSGFNGFIRFGFGGEHSNCWDGGAGSSSDNGGDSIGGDGVRGSGGGGAALFTTDYADPSIIASGKGGDGIIIITFDDALTNGGEKK